MTLLPFKLKQQKIKIFIIIAIFVLGAFLRFYHYSQFPVYGETADEMHWAWLGASLLSVGQPISWSYFGPYKTGNYIYKLRKNEAPLVKPALDHPPLFSFLPGSAHLITRPWEQDPSVTIIRLPIIFLSLINLWLFYFLSKKIFPRSFSTQALAFMLFATIPMIVFANRLVISENLLITWQLTTLLVLLTSPTKYKHRSFYLIILSILALLTKISGIIIPLTIISYGFYYQNKKIIKTGISGLILALIVLLTYVSFYNLPLFLALQSQQAQRLLGLTTLINRFFLNPTIVKYLFIDGWILASLFALFSLTNIKDKQLVTLIVIPALWWLLFVATTAGEATFHGWYNYPLWPFLTLSLTYLFSQIIKQKNYLTFAFLWLLLLPALRLGLYYSFGLTWLSNFIIRLIYSLGFIPIILNSTKFKKLALPLIYFCLSLLLLANLITVLFINHPQYWEDHAYFHHQY